MDEAARARGLPNFTRLPRTRPQRGPGEGLAALRGALRDVRRDGRALLRRRGALPLGLLRRRGRLEPGGLERGRRAGERTRTGPMRDRILAVLVTLAVFAAGLGAGLWAERHRPLPAPPGAFLG